MSNAKEFRTKELAELKKLAFQTEGELYELLKKRMLGTLSKGSVLKEKRKEIARILTVVAEKEGAKDVKKET